MQKSLRSIAEFSLAGVSSIVFALAALAIILLLLTGNGAEKRDVVSYWAAAHQFAQHQDPYDSEAILRIEHSLAFPPGQREIIIRNPPWALPLVLPLSLFSFRAGALLWSLLLIASLAASVRIFWVVLGRPNNHLYLLGYCFSPALACIFAGQTALFVLLGLVLFLRLLPTRPFLAGASLWLCALKPHLFLPFGVVLLAWIVMTRNFRVLAGAATALAASSAIAFRLDPLAWAQYRHMMSTWGIDQEYHPCLSVAIRLALRPDAMWLQYLPAALGSAWALFYFSRHRDTWNWVEHGSLLVLVSVFVAPYAWLTDQAILLPAVLYGALCARSRNAIALVALLTTAIQIEILCRVPFNSPLYLWTAPVWLAWYLYAANPRRTKSLTCPNPAPMLS